MGFRAFMGRAQDSGLTFRVLWLFFFLGGGGGGRGGGGAWGLWGYFGFGVEGLARHGYTGGYWPTSVLFEF